jgi:hypothetical protein
MRILSAILIGGFLLVSSLVVMAGSEEQSFFGQMPPGKEPAAFASQVLTSEKHPHGQLIFAPDGKTIYWAAAINDGPEQTIVSSTFDGKVLSAPIKASFAADSGVGGLAISPDGKRMFFNADLPMPGDSSKTSSTICYVEKAGSGWGKPMPIESTIDTIMTKGQVTVARNGNIYFSGRILSERTPAIFICKYIDGRYLPPKKLTGEIASLPLVMDPWIDPDERFMFLSCPPKEGPPMLTDIGISYHQADGGWSKPIDIGGGVNTSAFERFPSLSPDGKYLFFIRSLGQRFVGDQAHFFWVDASILDSLRR